MILELLKATFSGAYHFKRIVSCPALTYEGEACFSKMSEDQTSYFEEGTYEGVKAKQQAYQHRLFQLQGDSFLILKSDGSLLHRFEYPLAIKGAAQLALVFSDTHICKNDRYHCVFSIESGGRFSAYYKIDGPGKDYEIRTQFIRS